VPIYLKQNNKANPMYMYSAPPDTVHYQPTHLYLTKCCDCTSYRLSHSALWLAEM